MKVLLMFCKKVYDVGIPYYIGKWRRRGAKFCARGRRDGTNGMVSGKTLDCFRQLKRPRDVG